MSRNGFAIFLLLLLYFSTPNLIDASKCTKFYKIVSGDYCHKIWTENQLTEQEFNALNPNINCNALQIGQEICISSTNSSDATDVDKTCSKYYQIASGDTCFQIQRTFNISMPKLLHFNKDLQCMNLQIDQKICIKPVENFCSKFYKIVSGDFCYKIWTDNQLTEQDFKTLNPDINCDALQIGQEICIKSSGVQNECTKYVSAEDGFCNILKTKYNLENEKFKSINYGIDCNQINEGDLICIDGNIAPDAPTTAQTSITTSSPISQECREHYNVQNGDTCHQIATNFMMTIDDFMSLNSDLTCDALQIDQSVCISKSIDCFYRYSITAKDTCDSLMTSYKLTQNELIKLNPKLDCKNLNTGQQLCIASPHGRQLPSMKCTKRYSVQSGDTCLSLQKQFGITIDEMKFLNPWLKCENLQIGESICAFGESSQKCSVFHQISMNDEMENCIKFFSGFDLSYDLIMTLNPTFECEKLNFTTQLCIGQGYFLASNCAKSLKISTDKDTCETVSTAAGITVDDLKAFNPTLLTCDDLNKDYHICIKSLGNQSLQTAQNKIINVLSKIEPTLKISFQKYQQSPSAQNQRIFYDGIVETIGSLNESEFQQFYTTNNEIKRIIDADTIKSVTREKLCAQMKRSKFSEMVKSCICSTTIHLYYCQIKMIKETEALMKAQNRRRKRDDDDANQEVGLGKKCSLSFPYKDKKKNLGILNACFGGGCEWPLPPAATVVVNANMCVPPVTIVKDLIKICQDDEDKPCESFDGGKILALKQLADRGLSAGVKICIGEPGKSILDGIGLSFCFNLISVDYKFFIAQLTISTGLDLGLVALKVGGTIKPHDMLYPKMCEINDFECETYCLSHTYKEPPGTAYGFLKITVLEVLGVEGIALVDEKFGAPTRAGCNAGTKAAIIVSNQRTCDKHITIKCWSGDDPVEKQDLHETGYGFEFGTMGNTLFVCQWFLESTGQMIGFDVYGGKSKNTGKKNFYYAVKNDGVYFGLEKNKINEQMGKWDKVCEGNDDDKNNGNGAAEPTGTSSIPAASCGKRIIGYYTGWGKREVDENQLKKLTHVIFGFVAMKADGTIAFDKVSEDSEADAGNIAKKRFMDLKSKARKVNAGVNVLFALGGWDNSQYFSAIAADSGRRKTFIDSIKKFLKNEKIDGVDLDWEYPVTGGANEGVPADKENFVELLKELRNALNDLQKETNRKQPYLISFASAAGDWTMRPAYDLENIVKYVDFINIMTYDYYGAWGSKWGKYTGPPAPLFYGAPKGFSGKLNADFTTKYYSCNTKMPSKVNMGVPFYGRFWNNVGGDIGGDEMWRTADEVGGKYDGGYVAWRDIESSWNKGSAKMHDKVKSPYIWDAGARKFLGFENEESLKYKVDYAIEKNIGGLMIWAIDQDDDANTLLDIVSSANLCDGGNGDEIKYKCVPINDIRWWIPENGGESKQGMCGKSAPLIDGFYPVCDPDDPGYSCCGAAGYCGSEKDYCDCETCVDYRTNPDKIIQEPQKPSRSIQWFLMDAPDGQRGRCGPDAPSLNGKPAICNPDDESKHCCSNGGYCGAGDEFCKCNGCINFRDDPNYQWN